MSESIAMGRKAKAAAKLLALVSTEKKNKTLYTLAVLLEKEGESVVKANQRDIQSAQDSGLSDVLIDRMRITTTTMSAMAEEVRRVAELPDPVGRQFAQKTLANGLRVHKQRVPIGVLAMIYESRPNVTVDSFSLALKSGNAIILRGGKEAMQTNRSLVNLIHMAIESQGLPKEAVQFIDSEDRGLVLSLLTMHEYIDMLIPRGGAGLHNFCRENSRIPVITGGIGICHLFVDESANLAQAFHVIHNAKTQRPGVCNALDTLLVHAAIAEVFLPKLLDRLQADGVSFRLCPDAMEIVRGFPALLACCQPAGGDDFDTEWLSLTLGIRVINNVQEAIAHIQRHSTGHSDGILTENREHADTFVSVVDSAAVYVNASTRFTDGGQLGLGAEVAVSTQKLHARGPMGLEELTTYKWVIQGDNHIRK
jgi:glutamate-5-semialdehyde dehydrogenase